MLSLNTLHEFERGQKEKVSELRSSVIAALQPLERFLEPVEEMLEGRQVQHSTARAMRATCWRGSSQQGRGSGTTLQPAGDESMIERWARHGAHFIEAFFAGGLSHAAWK